MLGCVWVGGKGLRVLQRTMASSAMASGLNPGVQEHS